MDFKYPLVKWNTVCPPIEVGSLGIRKMVMVFWASRYTFLVFGDCFKVWGERDGPCRGTHGCSLWQSIRAG